MAAIPVLGLRGRYQPARLPRRVGAIIITDIDTYQEKGASECRQIPKHGFAGVARAQHYTPFGLGCPKRYVFAVLCLQWAPPFIKLTGCDTHEQLLDQEV